MWKRSARGNSSRPANLAEWHQIASVSFIEQVDERCSLEEKAWYITAALASIIGTSMPLGATSPAIVGDKEPYSTNGWQAVDPLVARRQIVGRLAYQRFLVLRVELRSTFSSDLIDSYVREFSRIVGPEYRQEAALLELLGFEYQKKIPETLAWGFLKASYAGSVVAVDSFARRARNSQGLDINDYIALGFPLSDVDEALAFSAEIVSRARWLSDILGSNPNVDLPDLLDALLGI